MLLERAFSRRAPLVRVSSSPLAWGRITSCPLSYGSSQLPPSPTAHEHLIIPLLLCLANEGSRFCPGGGPWPDLKQPHKEIDNSKMVLSTVKSGPPILDLSKSRIRKA